MDSHRQHGSSDLFLVRVWALDAGDGQGEVEWHGKVQRVTDGEAHQWQSWQELVDYLLAMLSKKEGR